MVLQPEEVIVRKALKVSAVLATVAICAFAAAVTFESTAPRSVLAEATLLAPAVCACSKALKIEGQIAPGNVATTFIANCQCGPMQCMVSTAGNLACTK